MKKLLAVLALSMFLGGCGVVTSEMTMAEKVKAVQTRAVELCAYLPQAHAVVAMLSAANPAVTGVGAVAQAICTAVTSWSSNSKSGTLTTECPRVNGVCVVGTYVDTLKDKPKGD